MKFIVLIISILFSVNSAKASIDSLWVDYYKGKNPAQSARLLFTEYAKEGASVKIDSALELMLNANKYFQSYTALDSLYASYFSSSNISNKEFSLVQAKAWVDLNETEKNYGNSFQAYHNLTKLLISFNKKNLACKAVERECHFADLSGIKKFKIEALFNKGKCFEFENKKTEAFKSYLDAYYYSLEIKDNELIKKSLKVISGFFVTINLYSKAEKYKKEELALFIQNNKVCDSNQYYALISELSDNNFDGNKEDVANKYSSQVLNYCQRKGNRELLVKQLSIIRSYYFENNDFDGLINLYTLKFPTELDSLKENNIVAYYRIQSLICERNKQQQEAIAYLDAAEKNILASNNNYIFQSNFYNRKGEFYLRQHMPSTAVSFFLKSYKLASTEKYYPFLKSAVQNLDKSYALLGEYQKAHYYSGLTMAYTDSLKQMTDNDEIVLLEVDNIEKQKELFLAQHEEQMNRKNNLQYMLIVILIASSFIVLIILGSIKIHSLVIRSLGYFVFIFFFEFIILLADNKIHHMTHGEPLKIMGFKIILIGLLLPIHHWVEHKVVHYLLHHHILQNFKIGNWLKNKLWHPNKKTIIQETQED